MVETLDKALVMISVIVLGYVLKKVHVFQKSDFDVISTVVMRVTLPCAIVVKLNGIEFPMHLLWLSLLAVVFDLIYMGAGYLMGRTPKEKSFSLLNLSCYNIGNFGLPFISAFYGSTAVLVACLFDAGNSIMCLGTNYGLACCIEGRKGGGVVPMLLKKIFTSVPVLCYCVMIPLAMLHVSLPQPVMEWTGLIASANTCLSMLMIGIALEILLKKEFLEVVGLHLAARFGIAVVFALLVLFVLPFTGEVQKTLLLLVFTPVAGMACVYTEKIEGDVELSACINSVTIVISVIVMSCLTLFL